MPIDPSDDERIDDLICLIHEMSCGPNRDLEDVTQAYRKAHRARLIRKHLRHILTREPTNTDVECVVHSTF